MWKELLAIGAIILAVGLVGCPTTAQDPAQDVYLGQPGITFSDLQRAQDVVDRIHEVTGVNQPCAEQPTWTNLECAFYDLTNGVHTAIFYDAPQASFTWGGFCQGGTNQGFACSEDAECGSGGTCQAAKYSYADVCSDQAVCWAWAEFVCDAFDTTPRLSQIGLDRCSVACIPRGQTVPGNDIGSPGGALPETWAVYSGCPGG